jgi:hypothetical protein
MVVRSGTGVESASEVKRSDKISAMYM